MNSIKLMTWNIRGVNNSIAKRNCGEMVGKNKVGIICLQETKSVDWSISPGRHFLRKDKYGMKYQPSEGSSGGLATFGDINILECIALAQFAHWIWITFRIKQDGSRVHLVNIYSPLQMIRKRKL